MFPTKLLHLQAHLGGAGEPCRGAPPTGESRFISEAAFTSVHHGLEVRTEVVTVRSLRGSDTWPFLSFPPHNFPSPLPRWESLNVRTTGRAADGSGPAVVTQKPVQGHQEL